MVPADVVEFLGQPTMARGSAVPPVRLVLPVNAGPRRGLLVLAAALYGLVGALGLAVVCLSVVSPPVSSAWQVVLFVLLWLVVGMVAIGFTGAAITCLRDLARRSPVLTLSRDGLWDRRLVDRPLSWSAIGRATLTYAGAGGGGGVFLQLRHEIPARQNPFRLGTLFFFWPRRPAELHISLLMLDVSSYVLGHAIAHLVQRHGGEMVLDPPNLLTLNGVKRRPL